MGIFDPFTDIYKGASSVVKTGTKFVTNPGKAVKDTVGLGVGLAGTVVGGAVGAGRTVVGGAAGAAGDVAGGLLETLGIDMNILLIGAAVVGVIILIK